jgi:hypothetical protein
MEEIKVIVVVVSWHLPIGLHSPNKEQQHDLQDASEGTMKYPGRLRKSVFDQATATEAF